MCVRVCLGEECSGRGGRVKRAKSGEGGVGCHRIATRWSELQAPGSASGMSGYLNRVLSRVLKVAGLGFGLESNRELRSPSSKDT